MLKPGQSGEGRLGTVTFASDRQFNLKFYDNGELERISLEQVQQWLVKKGSQETEKNDEAKQRNKQQPAKGPVPTPKERTHVASTYNVKCMANCSAALNEIADRQKPLFMLLQETHLLDKVARGRRIQNLVPKAYRRGSVWGSLPAPTKKGQFFKHTPPGGVALLLRSDVAQLSSPRQISVPLSLSNYLVGVTLSTPSNVPVHVVCMYAPPCKTDVVNRVWKHARKIVRDARLRGEGVLLGGDLTARTGALTIGSSEATPRGSDMC